MKSTQNSFQTIDEYTAAFPKDIQSILETLRQTIHTTVPGAEETISYQMPAFKLNGIIVYFAAFKNHIGFFPTSSGVAAFKKDLSHYKISKGTIQFPFDKPLPLPLIRKIVKFRVKELSKKAKSKRKL